jgi:ABC-type multidrug transport system fused ATPase/permease subunit
MENELYKLAVGFFNKNKQIMICSIFFAILCSTIESVIIPNTVAETFNSLGSDDPRQNPEFKSKLIKLIFSWISIKLVYAISNYFRKKLEPAITQYITIELIKSVFKKYEMENEITNVSVLVSKIQLIKKNVQDLFYILTSVFIPRILVIFISCYNFYRINKEIGVTVLLCMIFQGFISSVGLNNCVNMTFDEQENKDGVYDYIEDIFSNIGTLQSTPDAFNTEIKEIYKITSQAKTKEEESYDCINKKQYQGYASNILIFVIIIYRIYSLYVTNKLEKEKVTKTLLSLTGLFENMYEITYYIPELTYKFGILKNNENFLKDLLLKNDEVKSTKEFVLANNSVIEFQNVSFSYAALKNDELEIQNHEILNNYSVVFPQNKIICLYGPSGSGKSTFIKMIFGIEKPKSGKIYIGGQDISQYSIGDVRKYISYINQNTTTLLNRTVYENILYGYYSKKELNKNKDEFIDKIKKIFVDFGFYEIFSNLDENKEPFDFLYQKVGKLGKNLSGGQKQIIHLLRLSFNKDSKIIILDEPSSALDDVSRNSVSKFTQHLNKMGKTIFLITHDDFYKNICGYELRFFKDQNPKQQLFITSS